MKRSSGILLHISSLPGPYGIGDFGRGAYDFIEFLEGAGQRFWQVLPLGMTGAGDSPYQSFSAFAGNPYFIDLTPLLEARFISKSEIKACGFKDEKNPVDYHLLFTEKIKVLKKAYERAKIPMGHELDQFYEINGGWLEDFATFMALKEVHDFKMWTTWEPQFQIRHSEAVFDFQQSHSDEIRFWVFTQLIFERQWQQVKAVANHKGIQIIGDLPIYVAEDSSDVWANPNLFILDDQLKPKVVSGCPPDAFSATGQRWGNPIYNWDEMAKTGYDWWVRRLKNSLKAFDLMRIDHFRGFEAYWEIPADHETAEDGQWVKGPGLEFFEIMRAHLGSLPVIAEDLGVITKEVTALRRSLDYPGMKILQFAFDLQEESTYLPHHYSLEDVVYTGTHDNETIMGWYDSAPKKQRSYAKDYLKLSKKEGIHMGFIRSLMASSAGLVIIPFQDYLGLGNEARMNYPSTIGGNWLYRVKPKDLNGKLASAIKAMVTLYRRG